jgi:hypothetical protein
MAYDIVRGNVSTRDWSRGGGQNIGTVGAVGLGGQGLGKKLVVGALVGAMATAGYLVWRGRHGHRPARNPMSRRVMYERGPGGSLIRRL